MASSSGGIPEAIKDSENGFLVGFKDKRADTDLLSQRVSQLLNDAELREDFGKKARLDAVNIFSTDVMFKKYLNLIGDR